MTPRPHFRCPATRRDFLGRAAGGFGALAFSGLFGRPASALLRDGRTDPLAPKLPHFAPRATSVIFLYMDGGPSQVDTFDYKPRLEKEAGQPIGMEVPPTQFDDVGNVLPSPWKFGRHGESGIEVSELFPEVAKHVDKLCVVRSMVAEFPEHTSANYFLHTGFGFQGRPSMGAWIGYGLGSECDDLPGFVVLNGGLTPVGGLDNFGSGFLPASYQGSVLRPTGAPIANVERPDPGPEGETRQRAKLGLLDALDAGSRRALGEVDAVDAAIANYELAFRMQAAVPELVDLSGETAATRELYGLDDSFEQTATYARQCLLARRLVQRGVRFVQLTCPRSRGDRWDQHGDLEAAHAENARVVDKPIAGLLADLESHGLLDTTLVLWGGEFGRTPMAQGTNGRDHNPHGFTMWLAGGGVRGGHVHGATDDYGYYAVEDKVTVHDLHATMLHCLGLNHKELTYRFSGRDMRLTDVHGEVIEGLLA